eukprot:11197373-Lingulodinium_polyedra.AAC.1
MGPGATGAPGNGNGHGLSGTGPRTTKEPGGGNGHGLSGTAYGTIGKHPQTSATQNRNDTAVK